jgi:hypothetical protein
MAKAIRPDATSGCGVELKARAWQRHLRPLRHVPIAASYVGVRNAKFGNELAKNIIQIGAVRDR